MKIYYKDEYDEILYTAYNKTVVPRVGDSVVLVDEEFRVKRVIWNVEQDDVSVLVTLAENVIKVKEAQDGISGRLAEMHRAILDLSKRQDNTEKKSRALTEQVGSVRKHINQRIQAERKET